MTNPERIKQILLSEIEKMDQHHEDFCKDPETDFTRVNIPASMSLLSGDRKPQIRFYGNRHSGYGNH